MKKRTTLKDIAQALNLSITTVSRALNDKGDIGDDTKNRVKELAKFMDYRPNYLAKVLHGSTSQFVGVIVPRVEHSYFASLLNGVLKKVNENEDFVIIGESRDEAIIEQKIIQKFINFNVGALLVAPAYKSELLEHKFDMSLLRETPLVLMDRTSNHNNFHQVTNDHRRSSKLIVGHLIEQGFKNIAHIRGLINDVIADDICQGYIDAMIENQLEVHVQPCDKVSPDFAYAAMESLYNSTSVDAVFAISDEAALGIYRFCYDHNISIPQQLAIAGYSGDPFSKYLIPSLTTINQNGHKIGRRAIEIALGKNLGDKKIREKINMELIVRESTRNPNIG